jgi:uncharacterized protein (DUF433 family)
MANSFAMLRGIIHGKTIELEKEPGLEDGQEVSVEIRPIMREATQPEQPAPPWWLEQLDVDPTVRRGKFVVKGTSLLADTLVEQLEAGRPERELLQAHPELTPTAMAALREYAKVPIEMRRSFGAWAEEAEELDQYLEWTRQHRKVSRRRIED